MRFGIFFLFVIASLNATSANAWAFGTNLIDNDSSFHVTYVRLDLTVRPDTEYVAGSVLLRCVAKQISSDNLIEFSLIERQNVDSVFINGDSTGFDHIGDSVFITLDQHYSLGSTFDVTIFYHGSSGTGDPVRAYQIWDSITATKYPSLEYPISWTVSEPFKSRNWWPCKDNPADKIDSADLYITCDTPFNIGSNGLLKSVIDNGKTRTFWWHESYPIDHYLIAWECSVFDTLNYLHKFADGTQMLMSNYVYPISLDTTRQALIVVDTILDLYERWFGPYPFRKEKYGIAQWHGGGMENQTLSFCNDDDSELVAHETAHQWFGDGITCKTWNDCWLNEGFATYTTDLFFQYCEGGAVFDTMISQQEQGVVSEPGGTVHIPDSLLLNHALDGRLVYSKGALLLNMLRFVVGSDSAFFRCIREYATGPLRYGVASADDFAASVSKSMGTDMSWFFNEWVYGDGYPIYSVSWDDHDGLHPSVAISQTGSTAYSPFFSMPIELEFKGPFIDTVVRVEDNATLKSYSFSFTSPISSMIFDPHNWLLDGMLPRTLDVKTAELQNSSFRIARELNNYAIEFSLDETQNVQFKFYDLLGRPMYSLSEGIQAAGLHSIPWEPTGLSAGVYFCRMIGENDNASTRFILAN